MGFKKVKLLKKSYSSKSVGDHKKTISNKTGVKIKNAYGTSKRK